MVSPASSLKPWEACFYHHLRTRQALLHEDPNKAFLHADLALKYCKDAEVLFSKVLCQLDRAHVLHALGKDREANKDLTKALNLARQIKSKSWVHYALMAEALFALDRGEEASCLAILRKALPIGREEGYLETYIDRPSALTRLCQKALETGVEVEHVQSMIRKRPLVPEKPPSVPRPTAILPINLSKLPCTASASYSAMKRPSSFKRGDLHWIQDAAGWMSGPLSIFWSREMFNGKKTGKKLLLSSLKKLLRFTGVLSWEEKSSNPGQRL